MVAGADALADPPHPLMAGDGDDIANDLMSGDAREGHRHDLTRANLITGPFAVRLWHSTREKGRHRRSADTASENFDNDLASLGVLPGDGDSLELSPRCEEGVSGVSRRKFRKGWHRRRKNRVLLDCWSAELREGWFYTSRSPPQSAYAVARSGSITINIAGMQRRRSRSRSSSTCEHKPDIEGPKLAALEASQ